MIPWNEQFDHGQARFMFSLNRLVFEWMLGDPMPETLAADIYTAMELPPRPRLIDRGPGTAAYTHADSLLQNTWINRELHELVALENVKEIVNPRLTARYDAYKQSLPADIVNGNEQLVFHGCAEAALNSIAEEGFLKSHWRSAAGQWQRFGPGL